MYIETDRLIIRDFVSEDVGDLQEIFGDDETMELCEPAYDHEQTITFLEEFCIERKGAVAAVEKVTGKVIGYILFKDYEADVYEIGWFFNRKYWGCGYAYEACKSVVDYAFEELYVHKIFAESLDGVKSVGLMKKLGMVQEGLQRSQTKDNHGNWCNMYLYGMLRTDWEQRGA